MSEGIPHHISNHDLDRYHLARIPEAERALIAEHLLGCRDCHKRAEENLRSIREKGRAHLAHISTDDLERYQRGQLNDGQISAGIEQHVSECRECADRMLAIERFVQLVRAGVIRSEFA
jgi:anti-sigma factor RsiW